jgi:CheY-like chemotaxis protein
MESSNVGSLLPADTASAAILVVDDDEFIREALCEALEVEGYRVTVAGNGAEALAKLGADLPNVILLDLMMPVMNGWQFRERQLADPRLSPIPVIVLSAHGHGAQAAAVLSSAAFLAKPFSLDHLLEAVETAVGCSSP